MRNGITINEVLGYIGINLSLAEFYAGVEELEERSINGKLDQQLITRHLGNRREIEDLWHDAKTIPAEFRTPEYGQFLTSLEKIVTILRANSNSYLFLYI